MFKTRAAYITALVVSFLFFLSLNDRISFLTLLVVLLLPALSFLFLVISFNFVTFSVELGRRVIEKGEETTLKIVFSNESIIPFPYVLVKCSVPDDSGRRLIRQPYLTELFPGCSTELNYRVAFRLRGVHVLGVEGFELHDMLGLFKVNLKIRQTVECAVVPRRLNIEHHFSTLIAEQTSDSSVERRGRDRSSVSLIRDYLPGDTLKDIHWKLSSKSDELQTKLYSEQINRRSVIYADLENRWPEGEILSGEGDEPFDKNELAADGVVEVAAALALRCVYDEQPGTLVWWSVRNRGLAEYPIDRMDDFNTAFTPLCEAASYSGGVGAADIIDSLTASGAESSALYYITGHLSISAVAKLAVLAANVQNDVTLIYYNIVNDGTETDVLDMLRQEGVKVIEIRQMEIVKSFAAVKRAV